MQAELRQTATSPIRTTAPTGARWHGPRGSAFDRGRRWQRRREPPLKSLFLRVDWLTGSPSGGAAPVEDHGSSIDSPLEGTGFEASVPQSEPGFVVVPTLVRRLFRWARKQAEATRALSKSWSYRAVPMVQIRLPPALTQQRTRPGSMRALVLQQQTIELVAPRINPRPRLLAALTAKLGRLRPDHLAHHPSRYPKLAPNRLDRFILGEIRPTDLRDRLHYQHPRPGPRIPHGSHCGLAVPGVPIGCRSPRKRDPYSMPIHNVWIRRAAGRGGTTRSNPLCSSGESYTNLILANKPVRFAHRLALQP